MRKLKGLYDLVLYFGWWQYGLFMRVYKTRQFDRWACKEGLTDQALTSAVAEMENGLLDADLGGHIVKKRVAVAGRGKLGGARTLLAYQLGDCAFFLFGFCQERERQHRQQRAGRAKAIGRCLVKFEPRVAKLCAR